MSKVHSDTIPSCNFPTMSKSICKKPLTLEFSPNLPARFAYYLDFLCNFAHIIISNISDTYNKFFLIKYLSK